jgi:hypothetical protein
MFLLMGIRLEMEKPKKKYGVRAYYGELGVRAPSYDLALTHYIPDLFLTIKSTN